MPRTAPTRFPTAYTLFDRLVALWDWVGALCRQKPRPYSTRFELHALEDRVVPAGGRPLPIPVIYAGAGEGHAPVVKAYDAEHGTLNFERTVYDPAFTGGVRVAVGDFDRDGFPDVVTAAGPGGGPHVRVLNGKTGEQLPGPIGGFWAYEETFTGGLMVAAADVDGDRYPDVITAAGAGGGPRVRVFSGDDGAVLADFFAFDPDFAGGASVAAADLTGDGKAELAVGAGAGGAPHVKVYDPLAGAVVPGPLGSFYAFDPALRGGVSVGADALTGDVDADGTFDLAVGSGPGDPPRVRAFSGATAATLLDFAPFGAEATGGVRVALAYVSDDPYADVVVGTGPGPTAEVRVFDGTTGLQLPPPMAGYTPFGAAFTGGVWVAASNDPPYVVVTITLDYATQTVDTGADWDLEVKIETDVPATSIFGGIDWGGGVSETFGYSGPGITSYTLTASNAYSTAGTYSILVHAEAHAAGKYPGVKTEPATVVVVGDTVSEAACRPNCDTTLVAGPPDAPEPANKTGNPVRYGDGAALVTADDFVADGFGGPWGVGRSWSNQPAYSAGSSLGNGWVDAFQPRLVRSGSSLNLLTSALGGWVFDGQGSPDANGNYATYLPWLYDIGTLTYDATADEFAAPDGRGGVLTFYGFGAARPAAQRGSLKSWADPDGHLTQVTSVDALGRRAEVQRSAVVGGSTVTESYLYAYLPRTDANRGKLASVTLRRQTGGGGWGTVRKVDYAYYGASAANGSPGDLKLATVSDGAGAVLDQRYYRYYTASSSTGYKGGMKYELGPAAYARLKAAVGGTDALADAASDATLAPYADKYFEYDSQKRVKTEVAAGDGCSACSGGQGTYTYTYTASSNTAGFNSWKTKTVETRPDGSTNTVYTNAYLQVMLTAFREGGTGTPWVDYYQYSTGGWSWSGGHLVLHAGPSAVTGYDDAYADLVRFVSGNAQYLSDAAGRVETFTPATATTATATTAGDVAGYPKAAALRQGETGTSVPQTARTYFRQEVAPSPPVPAARVDNAPAAETVYRNADGTGTQTIAYAHTWYSGTTQRSATTVTLPTVTTAQNGPNAATSGTVGYDVWGWPVWAKDGAGFLTYAAFDIPTGGVTKTIADVDTTQTATFTGLPSGWSTPTGGGLHLTATYEVDALGRATKATAPNGRVDYTVYNDPGHAVRVYPGWDATANTPTGPTLLVREDRANGYTEALTMSAAPAVSGGRPTGAEAVSGVQSLARSHRNTAGQTVSEDAYFSLSGLTYSTSTTLGTEGTHFYRTERAYAQGGHPNRTVSPQDTVYRTVYDGRGRPVSEWVGTDDTPTSGSWSPTNTAGTNLVKVREYEYDGGGVGDDTRTKTTAYPGLGAAARVTRTWYDWRGRPVATKGGVETSEATDVNRPLVYLDYDNLDQVTKVRRYDADGVTPTVTGGVPDVPSASLLRAQTGTSYDELGRVYRAETYSVDPSTGSVGTNTLNTDAWYDARGLVVKSAAPGGVVTKTAYDGAGRPTTVSATDGGGDSGYTDADDVTGDAVLEQAGVVYDASGNVLSAVSKARFHDETATGPLGDAATAPKARVSYAGYYYDLADRPTAAVNMGTNGGSAWTRPGSVPSRSDTVLVASTAYDAAGRVQDVTDPKGVVARTTYDALGRVTKTVANYVDGTVSDADDLATEYAYNGTSMTSLTVRLTGGGSQVTQWVYGVTTAGGSGVESNDVVGATRWPDPSTGAASSGQQETATVNALGQTATATDRNGTVHALTYDVLGRVTVDAVTTLGANVDGAVRRVEAAYDGQGNRYLVSNYSAASGGSVVNQVKREYNGLGQLTADWQSHGGAVTGSTPKVQYAYSEMAGGANHSRPTSVTHPSGYVLTRNYASGLDSTVSRLSSLSDTTGTLESYDYLGLGTVVRRAHPQPGVDLTYVKQTGESDGDAGDKYAGLDRFGRVVDQRWIKTSSGTATDRFGYGYDRAGGRTHRDDLVNAAFGELYAYDGTGQVTSFDRGTLNGTKTGITGTVSRAQDWDYDAAGNWDSVTTDGTAQTRTANRQNEVTAVGGATPPAFDASGNMTGDETGKQYVYDAWNRPVAVKNSGGTTLETLAYDGLGRRVSGTASGTTTDLYYSDWQVVEETVGSNTAARWVWSSVYVDAAVVRDRDTDANGTLDERLWAQQDANWNLTALVNASGVAVERYSYDPFGTRTVYDGSHAVRAGGTAYAMPVGFQGLRQDTVSGLLEADRRWYSPALGRWTSLDPIRYAAGDGNLYRSEGNDPLNRLDPRGTDFWDRFNGAGRVIFGGVEAGFGFVGGVASGPTVVGPILGAAVMTHGTDEAVHGFMDIWYGTRHRSWSEELLDRATGVPGSGQQIIQNTQVVAGGLAAIRQAPRIIHMLRGCFKKAPAAPKPLLPTGGRTSSTLDLGTPRATVPEMTKAVRELTEASQAGRQVALTPEQVRGLTENARRAARVYWEGKASGAERTVESLQNQLNLDRWRYLDQAPEARAILDEVARDAGLSSPWIK